MGRIHIVKNIKKYGVSCMVICLLSSALPVMAAQTEEDTAKSELPVIGSVKPHIPDIGESMEKPDVPVYGELSDDFYYKNEDWESIKNADSFIVSIELNENKTVSTALKEYEGLDYVYGVEPNYILHQTTQDVLEYTIENGAATLTKYNGGEADSVVIPDTLGGYPIKTIGENAFRLAKVKKVIIPEGITLIKREAFSCAALREVVIPESVTNIETQAFYASSLTEISIPKGVSAIGDMAFSTISLKKVTVDAENKNFVSENNVLYTKDKKELVLCTYPDREGTFIVPEGVTSVRSHAFLNCIGITRIVLPDTLETIGDGAFSHTGITEIVIPEPQAGTKWNGTEIPMNRWIIFMTGAM